MGNNFVPPLEISALITYFTLVQTAWKEGVEWELMTSASTPRGPAARLGSG